MCYFRKHIIKGNVFKYYVKTIAEEKKHLEDALSLVIHYTQLPVSNQVNINFRYFFGIRNDINKHNLAIDILSIFLHLCDSEKHQNIQMRH